MENIFIGGGDNNANKIIKIAPLAISLLFVIISLSTIPGTVFYKTKYVKKDDPDHQLKLSDVSIPVSLLSFTILLLLVGIVLNMKSTKEYLENDNNQ